MLNAASYDMIVHPRDNELVVGTHGRSVFVADVKPLQALKNKKDEPVVAFSPDPVIHDSEWGKKEFEWDKVNEPRVSITYFIGKPASSVDVEVYDEKDNRIATLKGNGAKGFHQLKWDLKAYAVTTEKTKGKEKQVVTNDLNYVTKGKYRLKFVNGKDSSEVMVEVK